MGKTAVTRVPVKGEITVEGDAEGLELAVVGHELEAFQSGQSGKRVGRHMFAKTK